MIRILFSLLLVLGCMGFPVQAQGDHSPSTASAKSAQAHAKTAKASTTKPATTTVAKASAPQAPSASTKNSTDLVVTASTPATLSSKTLAATTKSGKATASTSSNPIRIGSSAAADKAAASGRLARLTTYWPSEGDYYTRHGISSTGIHLHGGHCAVDPRIIPYGSVVDIAGVGKYLAVDTGSAVISREAARGAANTTAERNALVIDLYFESRKDAQDFSTNAPKYAAISWYTPDATGSQATAARHLFADENWTKIQHKQL